MFYLLYLWYLFCVCAWLLAAVQTCTSHLPVLSLTQDASRSRAHPENCIKDSNDGSGMPKEKEHLAHSIPGEISRFMIFHVISRSYSDILWPFQISRFPSPTGASLFSSHTVMSQRIRGPDLGVSNLLSLKAKQMWKAQPTESAVILTQFNSHVSSCFIMFPCISLFLSAHFMDFSRWTFDPKGSLFWTTRTHRSDLCRWNHTARRPVAGLAECTWWDLPLTTESSYCLTAKVWSSILDEDILFPLKRLCQPVRLLTPGLTSKDMEFWSLTSHQSFKPWCGQNSVQWSQFRWE
jgi:hypothetical protein